MPNFFQRIEEKRQQQFEKRLRTFFNQQTVNVELPSSPNEKFYEAENKVWWQAQDASDLITFYKTRNKQNNSYSDNNQFFKVSAGSDIAMVHYNLAQVITKSMVNLLFSKSPIITAKSGNQKTDKIINTALEDIYKDNEYKRLFNKAAEYASYSGRVGFKLILDNDVSKYPIIQVYPKEAIDIVKMYDRVTEIIFKDYYRIDSDASKMYVLYSIYGKGYIKYKLFREGYTLTNMEANRTEVPLNTVPELADLKDQEFLYKNGEPLDKILAVVIDNKENGRSDYYGCIDDFISIDEAYSNMITYIRRSGIKLYLPESAGIKDPVTGDINYHARDYTTSVTFVPNSNPNWQNMDIKRDSLEIKNSIDAYHTAMYSLITRALQTCGLSPVTIGFDKDNGRMSGVSLSIRERASLRTRDEKIQLWSEGISNLSLVLLLLYSAEKRGEKLYLDNIDPNIIVEFPPFERDITEENSEIDLMIKKLNNGLLLKKDALKELYPDMNTDDIDKLEEELKNNPIIPVENIETPSNTSENNEDDEDPDERD